MGYSQRVQQAWRENTETSLEHVLLSKDWVTRHEMFYNLPVVWQATMARRMPDDKLKAGRRHPLHMSKRAIPLTNTPTRHDIIIRNFTKQTRITDYVHYMRINDRYHGR